MALPFVLDTVDCCAISPSFGIAAFATRSGVSLIDLDSHQISFRCDLRGKIARKIMISGGQGWIVIATDSCEVLLFSINCDLIRQSAFEREIVDWKCFKNSQGIDFVIVCDLKGDIKVGELFTLHKENRFCCLNMTRIVTHFFLSLSLPTVHSPQSQLHRIKYIVISASSSIEKTIGMTYNSIGGKFSLI
jgi:hypothetical protein